MTWKDRRLEYLNLREDIYQNILPDDEKENVWIPTIGIRKYINKTTVRCLCYRLIYMKYHPSGYFRPFKQNKANS